VGYARQWRPLFWLAPPPVVRQRKVRGRLIERPATTVIVVADFSEQEQGEQR